MSTKQPSQAASSLTDPGVRQDDLALPPVAPDAVLPRLPRELEAGQVPVQRLEEAPERARVRVRPRAGGVLRRRGLRRRELAGIDPVERRDTKARGCAVHRERTSTRRGPGRVGVRVGREAAFAVARRARALGAGVRVVRRLCVAVYHRVEVSTRAGPALNQAGFGLGLGLGRGFARVLRTKDAGFAGSYGFAESRVSCITFAPLMRFRSHQCSNFVVLLSKQMSETVETGSPLEITVPRASL